MERQYVSFFVFGLKYCIDIMNVEEVAREDMFTKMPDMPPFVVGIMNLRGIVIPIISVKKKLGLVENREEIVDNTDDTLAKKEVIAVETKIEAIETETKPDDENLTDDTLAKKEAIAVETEPKAIETETKPDDENLTEDTQKASEINDEGQKKENKLLNKLKRNLRSSTAMKLIIVKIDDVQVGFLVDSLDRVFSVDSADIQSAEGVASSIEKAMIEGLIKRGDELYIILNVKRMLDYDEKKFIVDEIIE